MRKKIIISAQVIGANIRRIRLEHGETQQHLGTFLGYGATTIANYESGYRLPDLETFFRIALHYGACLEDFIEPVDSSEISLQGTEPVEDFFQEVDPADPGEVHES